MISIKSNEKTFEYFSFGTGEKSMLMLPGASVKSVALSAEAVAQMCACFAEKYTVYVFCVSHNWQSGYSIPELADELAELIEELGIKKADVLGCSFGGMIAQHLAIRHPAAVNAMVLASTLSHNCEMSRETFSEWKRLADAGDVVGLNRSMNERVYSRAYYEKFRDVFFSLETAGEPFELERFSATMDACLGMDSTAELYKISCPVLVVGAWEDNTLSAQSSIELARRLGCELFIYRGYGHAVYDEAADFRPNVIKFFEKC